MMRLRIMFSHAAVVVMAVACGAGLVGLALFAPLWVWVLIPFGVAAQINMTEELAFKYSNTSIRGWALA